MLKKDCDHKNSYNRKNGLSIKDVLCSYDRMYIWLNQCGTNIPLAVNKRRIIYDYLQKWYSGNSCCLKTYCIFKHNFETECYKILTLSIRTYTT